ncbi:hypothetical protein DF185_19955 [Marinifilum breve]|uniref:Uncharacterized protein n=1 Tax=Marinifilum breve TaxID=2184082 RepID=A0A2V3ZTA3_9BACT|nr:hypothetical protein [Marinifilum breve]PXX96917.1 hypothetical protein DF185_19955 [Marinifilum breve]
MNARLAVKENEIQVRNLFNSSVELAERKGISVEEVIDFKVKIGIKFSKTESQKAAWELRGEQAKELNSK